MEKISFLINPPSDRAQLVSFLNISFNNFPFFLNCSPSLGVASLAFAAGNSRRQLGCLDHIGRIDTDTRETPGHDDILRLVGIAFVGFGRRCQRGAGIFRVGAGGAASVQHQADNQTAHQNAGQRRQNDDDGQIRSLNVKRLGQDLSRFQAPVDDALLLLIGIQLLQRRIQFVKEFGGRAVGRHRMSVHFQSQMSRFDLIFF